MNGIVTWMILVTNTDIDMITKAIYFSLGALFGYYFPELVASSLNYIQSI